MHSPHIIMDLKKPQILLNLSQNLFHSIGSILKYELLSFSFDFAYYQSEIEQILQEKINIEQEDRKREIQTINSSPHPANSRAYWIDYFQTILDQHPLSKTEHFSFDLPLSMRYVVLLYELVMLGTDIQTFDNAKVHQRKVWSLDRNSEAFSRSSLCQWISYRKVGRLSEFFYSSSAIQQQRKRRNHYRFRSFGLRRSANWKIISKVLFFFSFHI
jgi:hypothetical protein